MGNLKIVMNGQMDTTVVSNQFIDKYMPKANGEYVKIYLFVLRCVNHYDSSLSIQNLADRFDHTVSYVLTALEYWAHEGLLHLEYKEKEPVSIIFNDLDSDRKKPDGYLSDMSSSISFDSDEYAKKAYSADEKDRFMKDKDFENASFLTQAYFKRLLGPSQIESLMFIYDRLGFDSELIDYLIEYCISRGKRSMRYAEAVAIEWKKQGITNVAQAKAITSLNSRIYYGVIKTMGISNRSLVEDERAYVDKWICSMKLSEELIVEACRRTIKATGKPEFAYVDSILNNWNKAGVSSLAEIADVDKKHQASTSGTKKQGNKAVLSTSRSYDMDDLEKKLLSTD